MGCDIHCYAEKRGEHGMGTPQGADTTETVLHVDAATRLPDAGMPLQEGHHAGGLEQCDSPQDQAEREHQSTAVMANPASTTRKGFGFLT